MNPGDLEKLIGGYATGTLSEAERRALFEAALRNQDVFEALADEEALREVLSDPRCRREVLAALRTEPFFKRLVRGLQRPYAWTLAGSLAATAILAVMMLRVSAPERSRSHVELASRKIAPAPALQVPAEVPQAAAPAREAPRVAAKRDMAAKKKEASPEPSLPAPPSLAPTPVQALGETAAAPGVVGGVLPAAPQAATMAAEAPAAADALVARSGAVSAMQKSARRSDVRTFMAASRPFQGAGLVRYTLLARGPDGQYTQVNPQTVFHAGDSIRLAVETSAAGYLRVFGTRGVLFTAKAEPGKRYLIDLPPGEKKPVIVLSRQPDELPPQAAVHPAADRAVIEVPLTYR